MSGADTSSGDRGDRNAAGDARNTSSDVNPAVIGPADVGEDVRADLEAAFARDTTSARDTARLRIKDDPPVRVPVGGAGDAPGDATVDLTGEFEYPVSPSPDTGDGAPSGTEQPSRRSLFGRRKSRFRSILEIAQDYDTRIKAQSGAAKTKTPATKTPTSTTVASSPTAAVEVLESADVEAAPVEAGEVEGKKRVVITDDTIDVDRKSPERQRAPRQRKRRFWSRNRTEQDDELSRLRKQRRASQRIDGSWRPRWYMVVGAVVVLIVSAMLLLTSPLLSIKRVDVEGNVYADPKLLAAVIDNLTGDPILTADLHGAKVQIEAIPWVRKARVSMHLPSRILIQVDERSPLAFVRSVDGFNRVLDRDGRVLDVIEGDPVDYTRIIGTAPTLIAGDVAPQPFLGTVQLINALPRDLADRLISATVSPEGEISLQFSPNLQVIFGNPADYQAKLVGVINEIKRQGTKSYTVIDVSSGEPNVR